MVSRRTFLGAAVAAAALGRAHRGWAAAPLRLAAIDWAMAETAMALGCPPVAMAELIAFRSETPVPLPVGMTDLGLRGAPNMEALSLAAPDLILSSSYYSFAEPQLTRIAPVFSRALYVAGSPPLPKVTALVTELAQVINQPGRGAATLAAVQAEWAGLQHRAARFSDRPLVLMNIGDARHVRVFGDDSLFGGVLNAIGLTNAWQGGTRFSFHAPVPVEHLAEFKEARFILVGAVPPQAARGLKHGALWNSLGPLRGGRVGQLPEMNAFGGLPSALHFVRHLLSVLEATG
ncbi:MAG: iron-siderophore ABC transporter substrate-binding protein [Pseudotabrizicola sp.]|uniref:iron-siderophore ABC transporter substrate-binding protein n=1 Tax=Pseudotabrizicola sp. TaxID=2939647 RepID=UPI002722A880|nr:iron-siderophore ABC transporter substrate-binding protein [Pseudotabrizicola sp.]MDO9638342.1 iron-siderophore ABC transporter substrate-binding protein [Pseudotabrizicola sp.]